VGDGGAPTLLAKIGDEQPTEGPESSGKFDLP
jgi:hypothetical protein